MKAKTRWHKTALRFENRISDYAPTLKIKGELHYDLFSFEYYKSLRSVLRSRKLNIRNKY